MAESRTTTMSNQPLESLVKLALGEELQLDVAYCDLVLARDPNPNGPYELRFRGLRQPGGEAVRFFAPLTQIEGALLHAGVLSDLVKTDHVPARGAGVPPAVALNAYALTITMVRRGNGQFSYTAQVRDKTDHMQLTRYLQALHDAAEHAAPILRNAGYAVGAADIISVAGVLYAQRTHRHIPGGEHA